MNAIKAAFYAALEADRLLVGTPGTLGALGVAGIYEGVAPQGAAVPHVVFHQVDGRERPTFHRPLAMRERLLLVKAVDENDPTSPSSKRAGDIDERCNVVLVNSPLVVTGYTTVGVVRESPIDQVASVDGKWRRFVGAHYRVTVS